ncbi:MAG: hypothetical protein J5980_07195 [Muribaculaceae bacterium]|nr:hypothetical protein [Muribaculaceae bacterium]
MNDEVFHFCSSVVQPTLAAGNGSANRAKSKKKTVFFFLHSRDAAYLGRRQTAETSVCQFACFLLDEASFTSQKCHLWHFFVAKPLFKRLLREENLQQSMQICNRIANLHGL